MPARAHEIEGSPRADAEAGPQVALPAQANPPIASDIGHDKATTSGLFQAPRDLRGAFAGSIGRPPNENGAQM